MADTNGLIDEYISRLAETEKPNLILAMVYRALFEREMQQKDWPQLGRLIKVFGRWRVFDAMLKASASPTFDATGNIWGYLNAICMSLVEVEKQSNVAVFKAEKDKQETLELIESLQHRPKKLKTKDKAWLVLNSD